MKAPLQEAIIIATIIYWTHTMTQKVWTCMSLHHRNNSMRFYFKDWTIYPRSLNQKWYDWEVNPELPHTKANTTVTTFCDLQSVVVKEIQRTPKQVRPLETAWAKGAKSLGKGKTYRFQQKHDNGQYRGESHGSCFQVAFPETLWPHVAS